MPVQSVIRNPRSTLFQVTLPYDRSVRHNILKRHITFGQVCNKKNGAHFSRGCPFNKKLFFHGILYLLEPKWPFLPLHKRHHLFLHNLSYHKFVLLFGRKIICSTLGKIHSFVLLQMVVGPMMVGQMMVRQVKNY